MTIYVSYLKDRSLPTPEQHTLDDVIREVRSDTHASLIHDIRSENTKDQRNLLKGKLPMFFPTVQVFDKNRLDDTSVPTGIVQFDIDVQDNEDADFDTLKKTVTTIPERIYGFKSPSGGLKFGILTDFHKHDGEDLTSLKERFKQAYRHCQGYVSGFVEIAHDDSMESLKHGCYLSRDADAFFNGNCSIFAVDDRCQYTPPVYSPESNLPVSHEQIEELLKYIPPDLGYHERLPINFAVFGSIEDAGIPILFNHWSKPEREELQKQLETQAKSTQYGNIGHLVNVAKQYGYTPTPPASRRKLTAKPVNYQFEPLLTVDEASDRLQQVVQSFFQDKQSMLVNVSTGFGKTQTVLEVLKEIPPKVKVLLLVPRHKLAEEIRNKFARIPRDESTFRKKWQWRSSINHIKGKHYRDKNGNPMCTMPEILKDYEDAGLTMPLAQCTYSCPEPERCPYIEQFSGMGNIRLMTHKEFVNEQSAWFQGSERDEYGYLVPRKGTWKPDFIIVDEDWMEREDHIEEINSYFTSIRYIVNDCLSGVDLLDAVKMQVSQVILDFTKMAEYHAKPVKFKDRQQYIREMKNKPVIEWSSVLETLHNCVLSGCDPDELKNVRFDATHKILISSRMVQVASRYKKVPTLYLDATADELVVKSVAGDIGFHSIKVKNDDRMNIYQLENYNWSKSRLGSTDSKNKPLRDKLVTDLKPYVSRYDSVGLITYKNVPDKPDFDAWLADQLGIQYYGHFGDFRGLDVFADVDCLLVVGRHLIPLSEFEDYSHAIFDDVFGFDTEYVDVPVRMKDGSAMALSNRMYTDSRVEHVKRHFSSSETIQAVGRGRLIHGKPKDVFVFSNESLGSDVEITDFFRYEEPKYQYAADRLKRVGYCENKPAALKSIGLTVNSIKRDRAGIDAEFRAAGIRKGTLTIQDRHYNKRNREYYVSDKNKLKDYLDSQGFKVVAIGK